MKIRLLTQIALAFRLLVARLLGGPGNDLHTSDLEADSFFPPGKVAVMTYADLYSWYAGSVEADVIQMPEIPNTDFLFK